MTVVLAAGCATVSMVPEATPPGERAVVRADPVVSAGLPVSVRLRRADGRELPVTANSVDLPPGRHEFVVDCRVAESGSVRRFTVAAELAAGGSYRLVATASALNCEAVEVVEH